MTMVREHPDSALSRRALLTASAAILASTAAAAIGAAAPIHPDQALLDLGRRFDVALAEANAYAGESSEEAAVLSQAVNDIEAEICEATAHTPAGLAVKARLVQHHFFEGVDPEGIDYDALRTLIGAVLALAGEPFTAREG